MSRRRGVFSIGLALGLVVSIVPVVTIASAGTALPNTSIPSLTLARTIRTAPFAGSSVSTHDGEGSAFVPNRSASPNIDGTDSLWLADDNGDAVWEIDPYTGRLKSSIQGATWNATKQYSSATGTGSGATAVSNRYTDIESIAYDEANDTLYVFSGKCCTSSVLPTAFRLKRGADHTFHPESWQALPSGSDYTAAAWHPGDRKVYIGVGSDIRTYDFATNASGSIFHVNGLSGILGMSFSADGNDLFVAGSSVKLSRVNWSTKSVMTGWTFTLTSFGMKDSRAVELINDQFYMYDGYDGRSSGDPLSHAVFVFNVCCGSSPARPVASFTTDQLGSPPLTMQFTDTSTNSPDAWAWDFDNNGTVDSTVRNPTHTFATAGDYGVKHWASNSGGTSAPVTQTVRVNPPTSTPPTADFTFAAAPNPPFTVNFTDRSSGAPTSWSWDFDGDTVTDDTAKNPAHTFPAAGSYPVTLTVDNGMGKSTVSKTVVVSAVPSATQLNATADTQATLDSPTRVYGDKTTMHGKVTATNEKRPYVKFNVTGLQGRSIMSARLRLFVTDPSASCGDWYSVSPTWIETGPGALTWSNAPPVTGTKLGTRGVCATGTWVEVDVTAAVTAEGEVSFAMLGTSGDTVYFATRETATPPQLVLTLS